MLGTIRSARDRSTRDDEGTRYMTAALRRALAAIALGGAALALVAACGSAGNNGPLVPAAPQAGWVTHEIAGVKISTPDTWHEIEAAKSTTDQNLAARGGDPSSRESPVFNVTVAPKPPRTLAAEVAGIRATMSAAYGTKNFTEVPLTWPGASKSTYLAYVSEQPVATKGLVAARSEWLFAALKDGTYVLVVVSSPEKDFNAAALHAILATVELPK